MWPMAVIELSVPRRAGVAGFFLNFLKPGWTVVL
jgi:hypothetical protein